MIQNYSINLSTWDSLFYSILRCAGYVRIHDGQGLQANEKATNMMTFATVNYFQIPPIKNNKQPLLTPKLDDVKYNTDVLSSKTALLGTFFDGINDNFLYQRSARLNKYVFQQRFTASAEYI